MPLLFLIGKPSVVLLPPRYEGTVREGTSALFHDVYKLKDRSLGWMENNGKKSRGGRFYPHSSGLARRKTWTEKGVL